MTRRRYTGWFGLSIAMLAVLALYLVVTGRAPGSTATARSVGSEDPGSLAPGEKHIQLELADPALIDPPADAYRRFASEDAAWRARYAPPISRQRFMMSAGGDWAPSPRQIVRDSVFALTRAGRLDDAIRVLERWIASNPRDAEQMLELARLLNQVGRTEESLARYRAVLALQGGGG